VPKKIKRDNYKIDRMGSHVEREKKCGPKNRNMGKNVKNKGQGKRIGGDSRSKGREKVSG